MNPSGLCLCGCGSKTALIDENDSSNGLVRGDYRRYLPNHHTALIRPPIRLGTVEGEPVAFIPLGHEQWAIVDESSVGLTKNKRWLYYKGYAAWKSPSGLIQLHRLIMGCSEDVDHKNGDGLDCRKSNMRAATDSQNLCNRGASRLNTTGYKGVHFFKRRGKYTAKITVRGAHHHLGYFLTPEQAAIAYNEAAKRLHGEFARLNSIPGVK